MAINGFLMTTVYAKINYKPYNWLKQWKFNPNNEMNSVKKKDKQKLRPSLCSIAVQEHNQLYQNSIWPF